MFNAFHFNAIYFLRLRLQQWLGSLGPWPAAMRRIVGLVPPGLGGPGSWAGPFWFGLGGPGSWAGPFWFGLGGPGPGPDPFGLAWGARVLGRTLLVWLGGAGSWAGPAYTINKLDSDKDVNLIRPCQFSESAI